MLTRQERERFVLDLYNQGKSIREIAEEARMSFRDIGAILNKAIQEKETSKEQAEKMPQSTCPIIEKPVVRSWKTPLVHVHVWPTAQLAKNKQKRCPNQLAPL